mmetsp:Transcript_1756/g.4784  ORF Transcript_1756/g.4784 Transcript_1756/m.4784 type:complete len:203 (+) Transcript_1756:378-986(+)
MNPTLVQNLRTVNVDTTPDEVTASAILPTKIEHTASMTFGQSMDEAATARLTPNLSVWKVMIQLYRRYLMKLKAIGASSTDQTLGIDRIFQGNKRGGPPFSSASDTTPSLRSSDISVDETYLQVDGLLAASTVQSNQNANITTPLINIAILHPSPEASTGVATKATTAPKGPPASATAVAKARSLAGTHLASITPFVGKEGP